MYDGAELNYPFFQICLPTGRMSRVDATVWMCLNMHIYGCFVEDTFRCKIERNFNSAIDITKNQTYRLLLCISNFLLERPIDILCFLLLGPSTFLLERPIDIFLFLIRSF